MPPLRHWFLCFLCFVETSLSQICLAGIRGSSWRKQGHETWALRQTEILVEGETIYSMFLQNEIDFISLLRVPFSISYRHTTKVFLFPEIDLKNLHPMRLSLFWSVRKLTKVTSMSPANVCREVEESIDSFLQVQAEGKIGEVRAVRLCYRLSRSVSCIFDMFELAKIGQVLVDGRHTV